MHSVDILLPLYKPNVDYLARQLTSINSQDYPRITLRVHNDDPNDVDREEFIKGIITNYPVIYSHSRENLGYTGAFEYLVENATADYLALCDQDDVWMPTRISEALKQFDAYDASMVTCDRSIIDGNGQLVMESYRENHPDAPEVNWKTGEDITVRAATTCYAIGMGSMYRTDVAKQLLPFPKQTAHDLWLALGASQLGTCVFIEKPLVQYRRHGNNASGVLAGISSKADWYDVRVAARRETAEEFCKRFPNSDHAHEIWEFSQARTNKDVMQLYRMRDISPTVAYFEILLRFIPAPLFSLGLKALRAIQGSR